MDAQVGLLPPRFAGFAERLPVSLAELAGPGSGRVELPLHLCWSGQVVFDLDDERERAAAYAVVLTEGRREDLVRWLDPGLLAGVWPVVRRMVGRHVRSAWESRFPELAPAA